MRTWIHFPSCSVLSPTFTEKCRVTLASLSILGFNATFVIQKLREKYDALADCAVCPVCCLEDACLQARTDSIQGAKNPGVPPEFAQVFDWEGPPQGVTC